MRCVQLIADAGLPSHAPDQDEIDRRLDAL